MKKLLEKYQDEKTQIVFEVSFPEKRVRIFPSHGRCCDEFVFKNSKVPVVKAVGEAITRIAKFVEKL